MGNHSAGTPPASSPDRSMWITLLVGVLLVAAVAAVVLLVVTG